MAEIIQAPWCIAMGDDSVEGYVEGARELYGELGHTCKDYIPCAAEGEILKEVNFCSHSIAADRCYLQSWAKTLFRYLEHPDDFEELAVELQGCPQWPRIYKYLRRIGRVSDKIPEPREENGREDEKSKQKEEEKQQHAEEDYGTQQAASYCSEGYDPSRYFGGGEEVFPCNPL